MLRTLFRRFSLLGPQLAKDEGKMTVVLDLDETLCYAFYPDEATGLQYKPDIQEDAILDFKAKKTLIYIYKRPHLDSFLELLDSRYEPILWSTGVKEYVDLVADVIDPKGIFRKRLYQEDCEYERPYGYPQFEFVKDIRKLRDDISRIVMVEDDWQGMYKHPDNFLHLEKFEAWFTDDWLGKKIPDRLREIEGLKDVRPFLRAKYMLKYSWAEQGMFYQLDTRDAKMAEYIAKFGFTDYDKIKLQYDRLFNPALRQISSEKLW